MINNIIIREASGHKESKLNEWVADEEYCKEHGHSFKSKVINLNNIKYQQCSKCGNLRSIK